MAQKSIDDLIRFTTTVSVRARARRELLLFLRRLAVLGALILGLCILGTVGFVVTDGQSVWNGFVLTLDTIATVGSIPSPTDTDAEAVKIALIVLGVGTLFYGLVSITEFFVAGHVSGLLEERRQRMIDSLSDHYVICGFGRVGRQVARDLDAGGAKYVVVDENPDNHELAQAVGVRFLEGSPSDDEILRGAGIERYRVEEIEVGAGCQSEGRTVADVRGGAIVVAVRRPGGAVVTQPPDETVLQVGDMLVALGTPRTLDRLEALFAPTGVGAR
ncbi:hypothetical protein BH20ACT18_BH20ACT18_04870 [soil metagenome]